MTRLRLKWISCRENWKIKLHRLGYPLPKSTLWIKMYCGNGNLLLQQGLLMVIDRTKDILCWHSKVKHILSLCWVGYLVEGGEMALKPAARNPQALRKRAGSQGMRRQTCTWRQQLKLRGDVPLHTLLLQSPHHSSAHLEQTAMQACFYTRLSSYESHYQVKQTNVPVWPFHVLFL